MKKIITILLLFCSMSSQANAADSGIYIAPKIGYSFISVEINGVGADPIDTIASSIGAALALGYSFTFPMRAELEWNMHSQSEDKNKVSGHSKLTSNIGIQTIFANVYYDFRNTSSFTPYVGAGLGLAVVDFEGSSTPSTYTLEEKTKINFAWNISLGLSYAFSENVALDLSYRCAQFGKGETEKSTALNSSAKTKTIYANQAMLALRYTF